VKLTAAAKDGVITELGAVFGRNCPYNAVTVHIPARFKLAANIAGTSCADGGTDVVLAR
jgi:hypothetical protein